MRHFDLLCPHVGENVRPIATVRARNLGEARVLLSKHPVALELNANGMNPFESLKVVRFRDLGLGTVTVKDTHWAKSLLPLGVPLRVILIDAGGDAWVQDPTGRYPAGICTSKTDGTDKDAIYMPAKPKVPKVPKVEAAEPLPVHTPHAEVPIAHPFPFKVGQTVKRVGPSQWVREGTLGRVVAVEEDRGRVRVQWPEDGPCGSTPYDRGAQSHSGSWEALEIVAEPAPQPEPEPAKGLVRTYLEAKLKDARRMAESYAARAEELEAMLQELP